MRITDDPMLWPDVCANLQNDFPALKECHPTNSLPDMALHLSKTHDLTEAEALETLHDWLWLNVPKTANRWAA